MMQPFLLAVSAFPSCGKTVTSNFLGRSLGLEVLSSSDVRQDLGWTRTGSIAPDSTHAEVEAALRTESALAYRVLDLTLRGRLAEGRSALVEGTFNTERQREMLYRLVEEGLAAELILVRCECSRERAASRIEHRRVLRGHGFDPGREILDIAVHDLYRSEHEPFVKDAYHGNPRVSLIEYDTDEQQIVARSGCTPPAQSATVLGLLRGFAGLILEHHPRPADA